MGYWTTNLWTPNGPSQRTLCPHFKQINRRHDLRGRFEQLSADRKICCMVTMAHTKILVSMSSKNYPAQKDIFNQTLEFKDISNECLQLSKRHFTSLLMAINLLNYQIPPKLRSQNKKQLIENRQNFIGIGSNFTYAIVC